MHLSHSPLGKSVYVEDAYNPALLYAIARASQRQNLGILGELPFYGIDIWNHHEVSWLNCRGVPQVAIAEIIFDCRSAYMIESKSLKLYFNALNQTKFENQAQLEAVVQADLSARTESPVSVRLNAFKLAAPRVLDHLTGVCIDQLDIEIDHYHVDRTVLLTQPRGIEEVLYSDLLRTNCPVTQQPDWASVQIIYQGLKIDPSGLLRYLVSYRDHQDFHENCIERIFIDILERCKPEVLSVRGYYTRRGGIDINPIRSTSPKIAWENQATLRQ